MDDIEIRIDPELAWQTRLCLGIVRATPVAIDKENAELWNEIEALTNELRDRFRDKAAERTEIAATRRAYRAIGDDPTHYRPANEALLRRVLSGKLLPRINTAVDANSYLSLASGWPLGCYNAGAIEGPITARIGRHGEMYQPIGKASVDATNRLVLADAQGIFGSPTADSLRTMVSDQVTDVVFAIFAFDVGTGAIERWNERAVELLRGYCAGTIVDRRVINTQ